MPLPPGYVCLHALDVFLGVSEGLVHACFCLSVDASVDVSVDMCLYVR